MLGRRATSPWLWCGRPTPWNRPSRSNSLCASISSSTSSVGKSSTRMITPSHRVRNVLGRRSNTSCAMASISASEGAFASVHIRTYLPCVMPVRILVLRVDLGAPIGDRAGDIRRGWTSDEADRDGCNLGCFCRAPAARYDGAGADGIAGAADRGGAGASRHGCVRAAPAAVAACADLSAGGMGARRLPALQPRPQRRARLHRALRAGVPAERHGDYPAHELLLAAGLGFSRSIFLPRISLTGVGPKPALRRLACARIAATG